MSEPPASAALVIGLGNPLMADDGLGLAALERLRREWEMPPSVCLVDGGTWGMNLLPLIEDAEQVILLDAIDAGRPAGTPVTLERSEVPRYFGHKLSPHQVDLREVLALAELRGNLPAELVAIGLQPARVEMATGLSREVAAGVNDMLAALVSRLHQWGHPVRPAARLVHA